MAEIIHKKNLNALWELNKKQQDVTTNLLKENEEFIKQNEKEKFTILDEKDSQFIQNTLKELKDSEEFKKLLAEKDQERHLELFAGFVKKKEIKAIAKIIAEKLQCSTDKVLTILTNNPSIITQIIQSKQITPETLGKIAQKIQENEKGILSVPIASPINKALGVQHKVIIESIKKENTQKSRLGLIENNNTYSTQNKTQSYSFLSSLLNITCKTTNLKEDLIKFVSNDTTKNHIPQMIKQQNTQKIQGPHASTASNTPQIMSY